MMLCMGLWGMADVDYVNHVGLVVGFLMQSLVRRQSMHYQIPVPTKNSVHVDILDFSVCRRVALPV